MVSITALTQGEGFHSSVTKDRGEFDLSSGGLERDVVVAVHVEDGMADGAWIDGRWLVLASSILNLKRLTLCVTEGGARLSVSADIRPVCPIQSIALLYSKLLARLSFSPLRVCIEGGAMLVSAGLGVGKGVEGGSVDEDNPGEYIFVIDRWALTSMGCTICGPFT